MTNVTNNKHWHMQITDVTDNKHLHMQMTDVKNNIHLHYADEICHKRQIFANEDDRCQSEARLMEFMYKGLKIL